MLTTAALVAASCRRSAIAGVVRGRSLVGIPIAASASSIFIARNVGRIAGVGWASSTISSRPAFVCVCRAICGAAFVSSSSVSSSSIRATLVSAVSAGGVGRSASGSHYALPGKNSGIWTCGNCWLAMIHRRILRLVGLSHMLVLSLIVRRRHVIFVFRGAFLGGGLSVCSAGATIKTGAVHGGVVVDDGLVVGVVNDCDIHIVH